MPVDVETATEIARPREEVAAYGRLEFADAPAGGTRMTLRNRGEPSGFAKVGAPVMAAAMRRANRKDLAALRAVLEGR